MASTEAKDNADHGTASIKQRGGVPSKHCSPPVTCSVENYWPPLLGC